MYVLLFFILIYLLYTTIWLKECFEGSIGKQAFLGFCFLMMSLSNFKNKNNVLGLLTASMVVAYGFSIFWTIAA